MKLSPLDIQHAEFSSAMNGYSKRQVREFLERVASELENSLRENQELRASGKQYSEQINELQSSEAELKRVVIAAERIASEIRENAKREAALTVQEARDSSRNVRAEAEAFRQASLAEVQQQRHEMLTEAEAQIKEARAELLRLEREQRLCREQFRALLQAFARNLESGPVALAASRRAPGNRAAPAAESENPEADRSGSS
jgi:cell division initiation protein